MRGVQEPADARDVAAFEQLFGLQNARVFLDDVAGAVVDLLRKLFFCGVEVGHCKVAEQAHLPALREHARGLHALGVPLGVKAVDERVFFGGIEEPEAAFVGQGEVGEVLREAIYIYKRVRFAVARHALVENAAGHSHKEVFALAAYAHERFSVYVETVEGGHRVPARKLYRRGRAQPRARRHAAHVEHVESAVGGHSGFQKVFEDPERIVDPVVLPVALLQVVHVHEHFFAGFDARKAEFFVVALGEGGHDDFVDGDSHRQPAVVVGVVADEFDSARSLRECFGRAAVGFFKVGSEG